MSVLKLTSGFHLESTERGIAHGTLCPGHFPPPPQQPTPASPLFQLARLGALLGGASGSHPGGELAAYDPLSKPGWGGVGARTRLGLAARPTLAPRGLPLYKINKLLSPQT